MFKTVILIACIAVGLVAFPMGYWLYLRERELRRILREREPDLSDEELRRRVRRIMSDR